MPKLPTTNSKTATDYARTHFSVYGKKQRKELLKPPEISVYIHLSRAEYRALKTLLEMEIGIAQDSLLMTPRDNNLLNQKDRRSWNRRLRMATSLLAKFF